jgi:polar amino acid transport system permease protein
VSLHRKKTRISWLDGVIALAFLGAGVYLYYRVRAGLHYHWEWEAIPQYLLRYDAEKGRWVANILMQGLFTTIRLSVWSMVLATLIGILMGLFRVSRSVFRRLLSGTYVELIRNLPPLVLIFIFYFFVSSQIMPALGVDDCVTRCSEPIKAVLTFLFAPPTLFSAFLSALVTLALFEGAYITEIVRGGIESIETSQWEASAALGLTRSQQLRTVILPQAVRRILPPLAGQLISTVKDSAIVSVISIQELTFQGLELMSATYLTFEIWITVTALYLLLTLGLSLGVERLEIRMQRSEA